MKYRQHIIRCDACCQLLCRRRRFKVNDALRDTLIDQQICINGIIDTINVSFVGCLLQDAGPIRSAGVIRKPHLTFVLCKDAPIKVIEVVIVVCVNTKLFAPGLNKGIKILLDIGCTALNGAFLLVFLPRILLDVGKDPGIYRIKAGLFEVCDGALCAFGGCSSIGVYKVVHAQDGKPGSPGPLYVLQKKRINNFAVTLPDYYKADAVRLDALEVNAPLVLRNINPLQHPQAPPPYRIRWPPCLCLCSRSPQ